MNKYLLIGMIGIAASSLVADDGAVRKSTTTTRAVEKAPAPMMRKDEGPVDRELEVRIGPRFTEMAGSFQNQVARSGLFASTFGNPKTTVDIRRDLGHDEITPGAQFDLDWKFLKRTDVAFLQPFRLGLGYKFDKSDAAVSLPSDITFGGAAFRAGSRMSTDVELHQIDYTLGYDVINNNTFRLTPFIGGKSVIVDYTISGTRTSPASDTTLVTSSYLRSDTTSYTTALGGFDARVYISKQWYAGIKPQAMGWEQFWFVQGDLYTGYDFTQNFGVRVGLDTIYANWESAKNSEQHADGGLGSVYVQAVFGF